jgi:hypothetical protein
VSFGWSAIVTVDRIKGIAMCAVAAGPLVLLVFLIGLTIESGSYALALDDMRDLGILKFCGVMSLLMLPIMVITAIVNHVLGLLEKDFFAVSIVSGAIIGYVSIRAVAAVLVGYWGYGFETGDLLLISANALLAILYWQMTVRRERNRRKLAKQSELALRAME